MKKTSLVFSIVLGVSVIIYIGLPSIIQALGIHPEFNKAIDKTFSGKKALIITTSQDKLGDDEKADDTGVFSTEMLIPYYAFQDAGIEVDIASIDGGEIPIEPMSLRWPLKTHDVQRYLGDEEARYKVLHSFAIDDVDFSSYDLVFLAGGWGAAYDLGYSEELGKGITAAFANQAIIGAVCHGPLGLLKAVDTEGQPLLQGRKVTGVTNKQVQELGIEITPMHPETELIKAGADYQSVNARKDIFANLTVVDGRLVTGQNQNASAETAYHMMLILSEK